MAIIDMDAARAALKSALTSKDDERELRAIANDVMTLMPIDHDAALRVLEHVRFLIAWRNGGAADARD